MVVPREDNLEITNFKGLDIGAHPSLIPDNAFSVLNNAEFGGASGEMMRRRGFYLEKDFTLIGGWTSGKRVKVLGSTFTDSNNQFYLITVAGMPYVCEDHIVNGFAAITGFPAGTICVGYVQWNNFWYFITQNNGVYKVTPGTTTATHVTGSPNGIAFCLFKERLWIAGSVGFTDSTAASTITFSDGADLDSWDPANIQKVAAGDGDIITCLVPISDRIMVFKKLSIWNMYLQGGDFPVSAVRVLMPYRGAVSTGSTAVVNGVIYFIAADGVWKTDGSTFTELSIPLRPLFEQAPLYYGSDQNDWVTYFDYHLYFNITSSENLQHQFPHMNFDGWYGYNVCLNLDTGAWTEHNWSGTAVMGYVTKPVVCRDRDGVIQFLQGSDDRIYSRHQSYYQDDFNGDHHATPSTITGTSIRFWFQTKRFSVNNNTRVKRLKYMMIGLDAQNCTPEYYFIVDGKSGSIADFDPGAVNQFGAYKLPGCGYFRTFEFNFMENTVLQPLRINWVHFIMHLKRQLAESPR